ncbi:aspartate kinase [Paludibacter propionicigenes WB4]|uniref:Aspartokinase n=1 Tax=Paludibacter propionicigenes (strain DSM 17365 / JCM 13257 / WB4) TaxID=694427 RepID=E4T115_PALPW|nr:aspartate kinase [Paludibacter propionicigenes]ADQ78396.1 aspartate kinase [Paludibacter propionicigenes WB4]
MKVYKFGGASVRSAEGIRNIAHIVSGVNDQLFIVVSAMGKTTNAMEVVLDYFMKANHQASLDKLTEVETYHHDIITELFAQPETGKAAIKPLFDELRQYITNGIGDDYDRWYDRLVSYGEVISTKIVSVFLAESGIDNAWLDLRQLIVTDSNYREANVRMDESQIRLQQAADFSKNRIYIGQGFIGANIKGDPTTLGREGSDYSAAVVGNLLNAESVTIWKDVPGILNADPRIFENTVHIPELTYLDAVELAYSGAQIIHPKTIKPLENKQIPLYVRPFGSPTEAGSVIKATTEKPIEVPILILRKNQVLVTIRPRNFSFVLEESLSKAFAVMNKHRLKVAMIQSSAISISVCVDNTRYLAGALDELGNDFKVTYNDGLELLTIRGLNDEIVEKNTTGRTCLLTQRTRRSGRFLMKEI